jgi:putative MATE family efflux protein
MAEQTFRTAMRTTDILVSASFSPAAVTAIGLADLYARFPLRIGLGLGGGAIALSSQDTGADATANRDQAISQALLIGLLAGIPFAVFGGLAGDRAIAILGAPADVARMGGTYLAVVFLTAPARHVSLVAARSLQGTGDTRTPMYVGVASNALNIAGSVGLGLGLLGLPRLQIVGVGLATAVANVFSATVLVGLLGVGATEAGLARPTDRVIGAQLVTISVPRIGEGLAATLVEFPFNSLLLGIGGVPLNAAYQIGRRTYQQVTSPLSRGYHVGASVLVGQALGASDPARARFDAWAIAGLGVLTVGTIGGGLAVVAPDLVGLFTRDAETAAFGATFARVYGLTAVFLVVFVALSGALQGASETRIPMVARISGMLVCQLGVTALVGVGLGYGALGAYLGAGLTWIWMATGVLLGFHYSDWATRAAGMMAERGSVDAVADADDDT